MSSRPPRSSDVHWQQMGAASGLLAGALFLISFVLFLSTDPTGTPELPSIANAEQAPAFLAANLSTVRLELLFNSLGLLLFLWFLGALLPRLRSAEGDAARGTSVAAAGASVGSALLLAGFALTASTALSSSPSQAEAVPGLYAASALLVAFGGGTFALFFLGVAEVILRTKAMPKWIGVISVIPGLLCLLAFMTPFFNSGVMNAANGVLGLYAWFAAAVVWLLVMSVTLTRGQRQSTDGEQIDAGSESTDNEGAA